jgi:soluble lytic murein transglycosylase-like protein
MRCVHALAAGLVVSSAIAFSAPARADVLEIAPDGTVVAHKGPAVVDDGGVRPLAPPEVSPLALPVDGAPAAVSDAIVDAALRFQLNPDLIAAVAWQESRFRHTAVSPKGAAGVMQLMPATARDLGVDRSDLRQNVLGGAAYLTQMLNRYDGDLALALAAYNAGPGAVDRYGGIPPYAETRAYVARVMGRMAALAAARR